MREKLAVSGRLDKKRPLLIQLLLLTLLLFPDNIRQAKLRLL